MITAWLHISELGGDPWVKPIWNAVNVTIAAKRVGPITPEMSELAVHISTRLNILPRIIDRLNRQLTALYECTRAYAQENVFTLKREGAAIAIDDDLKYQTIADIDALLFEINSCAELMQRFFCLVSSHAGNHIAPNKSGAALREALAKKGIKEQWFKLLDENRNFFSHTGAPYLAIDVSDKNAPEILVLKENIRSFEDESKFVRLSDLREIVSGFGAAKAGLQAHLIEVFN